MSTLARTEQRIFRAVDRLEAAFRAAPDRFSWDIERSQLIAQIDALARDAVRLEDERAELRQSLDELRRRHDALQAVATATEERLEVAMTELDNLLRA